MPLSGSTLFMGSNVKYQFPFARYPAVRIVLLMTTGIVIDRFFEFLTFSWIGLFFLTTTIFFCSTRYLRRRYSFYLYQLVVCSYLLLVMAFGGSWHSLWNKQHASNSKEVFNSYTWKTLSFSGSLVNIQQTGTGKYQLDFSVDTTHFDSSQYWSKNYNMRTVLDPEDHRMPDWKLGDYITFGATVYPLEGKRNPHQFDYKNYLASQNIFVQSGLDSVYSITPTSDYWTWHTLRQKTIDLINHNFSQNNRSLAKALLIGYKNELDRDEKIAFSRVGLSHIMAVSGLHVGFLLAPFWLLIPLFWRIRYGRPLGLLLIIGLLYFYAGLTDFSASVTRASITGGFIMYARLFNKVRDTINLTAIAAIIILLWNPTELFEIGFQLSFGAVFAILLIMPSISRLIAPRIRFRWTGSLLTIILVSLVVQLALFPLLSYYFGEFSLIGPLANALVIPALTLAVPLALFLLLVSAFSTSAGTILNIPNDWILSLLNEFVHYSAALPFSWMQTTLTNPIVFALWIAIIFGIASWNLPTFRWKILIIFLGLLVLDQTVKVGQKLGGAELEVTIFDVGQGDAALVKTPQNRHFLIDAGRWTPNYNSARHVIIPHLKAEGIHRLDGVFLSHPHADHIGGVVELIHEIPIDTIYDSGFQYDSRLYADYLEAAEERNIPVVSLKSGDLILSDPNMPIFVYGPDGQSKGPDPNEHSLILELIYGETEFLFTGDAGEQQERKVLQQFESFLKSDFLKVGHHASNTSSTDRFLAATDPQTATVSLALSNRFQHPHPKAVQRLNRYIDQIYYTSLNGALIFKSDGKHIRRRDWR